MTDTPAGRCLCGAVRYTVDDALFTITDDLPQFEGHVVAPEAT